MSNRVNSNLLKNFYQHTKDDGISENYRKGNLKAMVHFADQLGQVISFYDVNNSRNRLIRFFGYNDKE
jgi:hypothetical protein